MTFYFYTQHKNTEVWKHFPSQGILVQTEKSENSSQSKGVYLEILKQRQNFKLENFCSLKCKGCTTVALRKEGNLHACVNVYECLCLVMCVGLHACTCIRQSEDNLGFHSRECHPPPLKQGFSLTQNSSTQVHWMASEPQGSSVERREGWGSNLRLHALLTLCLLSSNRSFRPSD